MKKKEMEGRRRNRWERKKREERYGEGEGAYGRLER